MVGSIKRRRSSCSIRPSSSGMALPDSCERPLSTQRTCCGHRICLSIRFDCTASLPTLSAYLMHSTDDRDPSSPASPHPEAAQGLRHRLLLHLLLGDLSRMDLPHAHRYDSLALATLVFPLTQARIQHLLPCRSEERMVHQRLRWNKRRRRSRLVLTMLRLAGKQHRGWLRLQSY